MGIAQKAAKAIKLGTTLVSKRNHAYTIVRTPSNIHGDDEHLHAAMKWLFRAQDVSTQGGLAATYHLVNGWGHPYPETTGYAIETFLRYAKDFDKPEAEERAVQLGDWEIDIQMENGAVRGGIGLNTYPIVFNTGQVMHGWNSLFEATGEKRFLDAAVRAAEWLGSVQDEDGCWRRHTYNNIAHTYNVRVAWAVLKTASLAKRDDLLEVGRKNVAWALTQEEEGAWIGGMEFETDRPPFTHTIAYTLRGLIESAAFLPEMSDSITDLVKRASDEIIRHNLPASGDKQGLTFLPGTLSRGYTSKDRYTCLTGDAQFATVCYRLADRFGEERYAHTASQLLDQVKISQRLTGSDENLVGGIAGSHPIWGGYLPFLYPNWAAKFFADALMDKLDWTRK